jgi:hypothetical protein
VGIGFAILSASRALPGHMTLDIGPLEVDTSGGDSAQGLLSGGPDGIVSSFLRSPGRAGGQNEHNSSLGAAAFSLTQVLDSQMGVK